MPEIVWPKPPEIPRIRFVDSVSKPEDLGIRSSGFRRFLEYFAGKTVRKAMVAPYGIETDSSGRIYVVDSFLKRIHLFDPVKKRYRWFPKKKTRLLSPIDIAIDDKRGFIYVSDSTEGVVRIFQGAGKVYAGEIGRGLFKRPTGIAVNQTASELLVVDTVEETVFRYALDDHNFKGLFGGSGKAKGRLHYPTHIFVTAEGIIYITDALNFRIQAFSSKGEFMMTFGSIGQGPGYFARPRGVATDSDGNIYVVDGLFDNVQIFDKKGRLLMAFGSSGHAYGEFWLPTGIYIDPNDRIYVSDHYNKRVQIFQYIK